MKMLKPKITPNKLGIPCYREDSNAIQKSISQWETHNTEHKLKVNKSMNYWEIKSCCTAL